MTTQKVNMTRGKVNGTKEKVNGTKIKVNRTTRMNVLMNALATMMIAADICLTVSRAHELCREDAFRCAGTRCDFVEGTLREDARVFQGRKRSLGQRTQESFRSPQQEDMAKSKRTQDHP